MPHLWRDFVHSLRAVARTPALSATIVLTVGIGLGATAGMLSVVQAVVMNPLPYAAPEQLFWIYTDNPPYRFRFSVVDYRALEADHPAFSAVAAFQNVRTTVTDGNSAERVSAKTVTGSYFPLLGQKPVLGRLFDPSDDGRGEMTVVLTHGYWLRRFAGDPQVLGRTVNVDGASHTVVGVLQPSNGPLENDIALFTVARWPPPRRKGPFFQTVLGRLRPGVSHPAAVDTLRATNRRLFPIWKSSYQDEKATWGMQDLRSRVVGDVGTTLLFVLAAVACVLLIACANAVNLLIARALNRSRELTIRSALGASRGRLLQHLVVESIVLTAVAALVGVAVTAITIALVKTYGVTHVPRLGEVQFSWAVLAWLALLSMASGLVIFGGGLVPAIQASRLRLDGALRSGGRSMTEGPAARRLRHTLVAAEFMLATPLVIAAVLVMASLDRLTRVPVGIETERTLTAAVALPGARYARDEDRGAFWKRALERVAALPGVASAALADSRPPSESGNRNNFDLEDHPTPPGANQPICTWVAVSPEFFRTVGLPLERGRLLDDYSLRDNVVVVDRAWANRFFPGQEVLGRRFRSGGCTDCEWTTVAGVVGNVKWTGLDTPADGTVYWPFVDFTSAFFIVKSAVDAPALAQSMRRVIGEFDPGLALTNVATGDELVATTLNEPRYLSVIVGVFATAALLLAIVGVYGVMAYFVEQHTHDIGIRLALGGAPSAVRRMIVLRGLRLVSAGVALGLGAAFLTARLLSTVLFGISATDPRTMAGVPLLLMAVAAVACLVPGRRAARLDPAAVLRDS